MGSSRRSSIKYLVGHGFFGVVVAAFEIVFSDYLRTPSGIKPTQSNRVFMGYGYFAVVVAASEQVLSDCLCTLNAITPYVVQKGVL